MATSRYDSLDPNSSNRFTPTITRQQTSGGSSSYANENTSVREQMLADLTKDIRSTTDTTSTTNTNTLIREFEKQLLNIDTMSSAGRNAMNQLLAQLLAGGTEQQRQIQAERLETLNRIRANQEQYSRRKALSDARGLMSGMMRQGMEAGMPSILLAQSGAGTSGNALSALLTQDLAARTAEGAATAGVNAVGAYGQILASLMGTEVDAGANLEDLVTQSLLQALQIDRGSMQRGEIITESERREKGQSKTNSRSTTNTKETGTESRVTNSRGSSSAKQGGNNWSNSTTIQNRLPGGSMVTPTGSIVNYNSLLD